MYTLIIIKHTDTYLSIHSDNAIADSMKVHRRVGFEVLTAVALLATRFTLVSCLTYSSTVKMEATKSSETSIDFQRNTRCYISRGRTVHRHIRESTGQHISMSRAPYAILMSIVYH
jgi:hypothetical protein